MRIDAFELDCIFRPHFTLAEVINGQATVLRSIRIRNIRGADNNRLHLCLELDGAIVRQNAGRDLPLGDEFAAAALEDKILHDMVLPDNVAPGTHTLRLRITADRASDEILTSIMVLPANVIPTDFIRAMLLPAYIQENDLLRHFAAEAIQQHLPEPRAETVLACLYDALLAKKLAFQPVGGLQYPDCQRIADLSNVLMHGGSCTELSLLFASLLWNIGQAPALLLFEDHMAVGCFLAPAPAFKVLTSPAQVRMLVANGTLLPIEATSVCRLKQHPFATARSEIAHRLQQNIDAQQPCLLINVQTILRQGLKTLTGIVPARKCSNCGYSGTACDENDPALCPACGKPFPTVSLPEEPAPVNEPILVNTDIQYALQSGGAVAARLKADSEASACVMDVWQGRSVVGIGDRAFARSHISAVSLPDTISRIGDYAFSDCKNLRHFNIPPAVSALGTGAFRGSGLQTISIPGSIARIQRLTFAGCDALTNVTLSEGIQYIDEKAFDGCTKLRTVTIPASVKRIEQHAFPPKCTLVLMSQATKLL